MGIRDSLHEAKNFLPTQDFMQLKQSDLVKILQREAEKLNQLQGMLSGHGVGVPAPNTRTHKKVLAMQEIPAIEIDLSQTGDSKVVNISLAQAS